MIGLFFSEAILFLVAGLAGLGLGWRLRTLAAAQRKRLMESETEALRRALSDAQVRRARIS